MPDLLNHVGNQQENEEPSKKKVMSLDISAAVLPTEEKKKSELETPQDDPLAFLGSLKTRVKTGKIPLPDHRRERLSDEDQPSGGITALDIAELPDNQKRVMFSMLRDKIASTEGVTRSELLSRFDADETLFDTLAELTRGEWLLMSGEPPDERYKLNLRRKKGRLGSNIWSALE